VNGGSSNQPAFSILVDSKRWYAEEAVKPVGASFLACPAMLPATADMETIPNVLKKSRLVMLLILTPN